MELILFVTHLFASPRILAAFAAIIHAILPASLCTPGTMVHFTIAARGVGGSVSKRTNGKQHHYNDEKRTFHDF